MFILSRGLNQMEVANHNLGLERVAGVHAISEDCDFNHAGEARRLLAMADLAGVEGADTNKWCKRPDLVLFLFTRA